MIRIDDPGQWIMELLGNPVTLEVAPLIEEGWVVLQFGTHIGRDGGVGYRYARLWVGVVASCDARADDGTMG